MALVGASFYYTRISGPYGPFSSSPCGELWGIALTLSAIGQRFQTVLYSTVWYCTVRYCTVLYCTVLREVLMGVGDGVASVIMLTFTKRPGPHADFYKEARPPC